MARPSVCYVVPSYSRADASHMAHLPKLLAEIARHCDLHVIVQRSDAPIDIPGVRSAYAQRSRNHLGRALELIRTARALRERGCRKFFVRISASAAFELGVLGLLSDIQVYYWQSGEVLVPSWKRPAARLGQALRNVLFRLNLRLAHRFVTGPEAMRDYYVREFGARAEKTLLLYNDVDLDRFRPGAMDKGAALARLGLPRERPVALFVGRVSLYKGAYNLLPLARRLKEESPRALLVIVGQLEHAPEVPAEARQAGLDNIRFVGAVPNRELEPYYLAADLMVLPSESQGFPRVLLEAMAYGLPVVAFDVGGVRDVLDPSQRDFLVPRGDVEAMARKAALLFGDARARAEQSAAGRRRAAEFSTEKVARMFVDRIAAGA